MYHGRDVSFYIEGQQGLKTKFYKHNAYWCFDVYPPYPYMLERPISYETKWQRLNMMGDPREEWAQTVLKAVKEDRPEWLTFVQKHQRDKWMKEPRMAEWYKIPKPAELEGNPLSTKVPKEELMRYRFEVVERFVIYVDARNAEVAKMFIEEGVPRFKHPAMVSHERIYRQRSEVPVSECET